MGIKWNGLFSLLVGALNQSWFRDWLPSLFHTHGELLESLGCIPLPAQAIRSIEVQLLPLAVC